MKTWIGLVLPLALGYLVTLRWIWDSWHHEQSYYSHGPLVPLVALFFLWSGRKELASMPVASDPRGWWLLGPGLFLHGCGAGLMIDSLSAFSLCLTLPGIVLLAQGVARWKRLGAVLGLVIFAVPMPMFVSGKLVFVLKEAAVDMGMGLANLLGAGAVREGANIRIPGEAVRLVVADACGGLRSLVSLLTVGYVIAFLMSALCGARRWILLALAVPIAILSNVVRIGAMCFMSRHWGVEFGSTTGHDWANVAVWILALGAMLGLDGWMTRRAGR